MYIIAFYPASGGGLSFRGTEIALYDYAHFCEKILGHKSIICLLKDAYNDKLVLKKFQDRFNDIIYFSTPEELEEKLLSKNVDYFYTIRHGKYEEPILKKIKMLVHAVYDMSYDYKNSVVAGVSESVAKLYNKQLYVPHMIYVVENNEDYREKLNIFFNY